MYRIINWNMNNKLKVQGPRCRRQLPILGNFFRIYNLKSKEIYKKYLGVLLPVIVLVFESLDTFGRILNAPQIDFSMIICGILKGIAGFNTLLNQIRSLRSAKRVDVDFIKLDYDYQEFCTGPTKMIMKSCVCECCTLASASNLARREYPHAIILAMLGSIRSWRAMKGLAILNSPRFKIRRTLTPTPPPPKNPRNS